MLHLSLSSRLHRRVIRPDIGSCSLAVGAADHLIQSRAGRHHRIDSFFLLDAEFDQHRTRSLAGKFDRGQNILGLVTRRAGMPCASAILTKSGLCSCTAE